MAHSSYYDSTEETLLAPDVKRPLGEILLGVPLHTEKGPSHVGHFPGQEQDEPSKTRKRRSMGAEDNITRLGVGLVTIHIGWRKLRTPRTTSPSHNRKDMKRGQRQSDYARLPPWRV